MMGQKPASDWELGLRMIASCPQCRGTKLVIMRRSALGSTDFAVRCLACAAKWEGPTQRIAEEFFHAEERRVSCGECLGWGFRMKKGRRVPLTDDEARDDMAQDAAQKNFGKRPIRVGCQRCGGHVP